jgi:hypothetical protein
MDPNGNHLDGIVSTRPADKLCRSLGGCFQMELGLRTEQLIDSLPITGVGGRLERAYCSFGRIVAGIAAAATNSNSKRHGGERGNGGSDRAASGS